ncbi:flavin reductase family protein [Amycolatopsis sp. WQ 127309]|uniref:flavin reductase family protein n=1 Tax=Amycolatopsis sp. WQ 127309 TaxID=2932773 RepID=UPI001FF6E9FF|nr:flavin reductase family protein [Amycolatopsis sp. WQ 127309]UOZ04352.1 flavin reductase family protein [Amycolatopsis sp. WQ 127309]
MTATAPAFDRARLRAFLGHFTTGVTVVTYRRGPMVRGATVNAFTSVSLDPPLVLVSLDRRSRSVQHLGDGPFVVNILAEDQQDVAMHFAGKPLADDDVPWVDLDSPVPRLGGTVGHVECTPWRAYDGGDHVLHVGEVTGLDLAGGRPLLFFGGEFPRLAEDPEAPHWSWSLDDPTPQRWEAGK